MTIPYERTRQKFVHDPEFIRERAALEDEFTIAEADSRKAASRCLGREDRVSWHPDPTTSDQRSHHPEAAQGVCVPAFEEISG